MRRHTNESDLEQEEDIANFLSTTKEQQRRFSAGRMGGSATDRLKGLSLVLRLEAPDTKGEIPSARRLFYFDIPIF